MLKPCHGKRALAFALCALWSVGAGAAEGMERDIEKGREVFMNAEPPCQICHTLEDTGATGRVGPNLDNLQPGEDQIRRAVREGIGSMPSYADKLSEEEIDAVAAYVATVTEQ